MTDVTSEDHLEMAARFRSLLATYQDAKDLIDIGAYKSGSNPRIDEAIHHIDQCQDFMRQGVKERLTIDEILEDLKNAIN
jgi:flagellum-specific ATP synthase